MAVKIEGMEMPKSCSACCLHVDGVCLLYDENVEIKNWNKRLPKCPLQEVKKESMNDWQDRLVKEYKELKEKYNALHKAIVACRAGVLPVTPLEGVEMWEEQASAMGKYLFVLEKRMAVHNIEVPKED